MSDHARALLGRLGIEHPIVQAPMAGWTTTELVAAVSNAGGLGSLGGASLSPDALRDEIRAVRRLTDRPFAVNLFAWPDTDAPDPAAVEALDALLAPHRERAGLPAQDQPVTAPDMRSQLPGQLAVVAEERVPVFSFTFGIPALDEVRAAGAVIAGTATTPEEAVALEQAGVDIVVAQGAEAGGHRGTFRAPMAHSLIGTMALVPQVVDAVSVPVVAAGGIMDGRGVAAALALGAGAAQLGTAFLGCPESALTPAARGLLRRASGSETMLTEKVTGRMVRLVRTPYVAELDERVQAPLPFPVQGARTRALASGGDDYAVLLAGQGTGLARELGAGELVATLAAETRAAAAY